MAFKRSFALLLILATPILASPYDKPSYSKPHKGNTCDVDYFYYPTKNCCLPHGGPPRPPSPPPGKSCPPTSHYWNKDLSCCTPRHPRPKHSPPPQCPRGHEWDMATQCCHPHGPPSHTSHHHKPSQTPPGHGYPTSTEKDHGAKPTDNPYSPNRGHYHKKRSTISFCPSSFEACPIGGLTGYEYECLDTTAELKSCGGCASIGEGQDCTSIKDSWNVGCEAGACVVYTCALGFQVSVDGKSCIAI